MASHSRSSVKVRNSGEYSVVLRLSRYAQNPQALRRSSHLMVICVSLSVSIDRGHRMAGKLATVKSRYREAPMSVAFAVQPRQAPALGRGLASYCE